MTTEETQTMAQEAELSDDLHSDEDAPLLEGDLDEIERKKQLRNGAEAAERKRSLTVEFHTLIRPVSDLEGLTQNPRWQEFYSHLELQVRKHAEDALLVDQSTKELIAHQQSVHIIRSLREFVLRPMDRFNDFINRHSETYLNSIGLSERVQWDDTRGVLEIYDPTSVPVEEPVV
jgi:hypothetical protein